MNKRYQVIYDTEHFTGNCCYFDTLKESLNSAIEIFKGWMEYEKNTWKYKNGIPNLTTEEIERWNYMIDTCEAYVVDTEYGGDEPEIKKNESYYWIDGHYYPSLEITEALGWKYIERN